jgi:hypothetical protein
MIVSFSTPITIQKSQSDLRARPFQIITNRIQTSISTQSDTHRNQASKASLPIPKGETPYAKAKIAEYQERNLDKAEHYYKLAIKRGERVISAIKDLASLLHQRGKTKEACDFLHSNRGFFVNDKEKFENLYKTLEKQLNVSSNSLNKNIKLSNLSSEMTEKQVKNLFENSVRIKSVEFGTEEKRSEKAYFCLIRFNSHSSARKTLEGFRYWDRYRLEWVNSEGKTVADAHYYRQKMEEYRRDHPTFDYQVFDRDPRGYAFCMPVDSSPLVNYQLLEQEGTIKDLLGSTLFSTIFSEKNIECC